MVEPELRYSQLVEIEPADPARFQEVLEEDSDVTDADDPWDEFRNSIQHGRDLLKERTIWNINSTAAGGGVAEMLRSLMAYARGAGVDARWVAVSGTPDFFRVTKRLHNMLHGDVGDGGQLGDEAQQVYREITRRNADELAAVIKPQDIVILHDPQTAGMVERIKQTGAFVVWRSHIGTETPNQLVEEAWRFLSPYASAADARVFSRYAYVPEKLRTGNVAVISPSIDPFSPKNQHLDDETVHAILTHVGLVDGHRPKAQPTFQLADGSWRKVVRECDVTRHGNAPEMDVPLVVQVSRWDRLKDPKGVMLGFAHVADKCDAQLVLAGPAVEGVADDPEGEVTLADTEAAWRELSAEMRSRIHLACLPMDDLQENAAIVNALQRHATVVVQKSLREGFGLTVTEAMWKARPVVASNIGGMSKQIRHGRTGLLLDDPSDIAGFGEMVLALLRDRDSARQIAEQAKRHVRRRFLHSHHLVMWVQLIGHILSGDDSWPALDSSGILSG